MEKKSVRLETARLVIRNFTMEDVYDLYEILGDEDTMKSCEPAYDFDKTKNFLQGFCIARNGALAAVQKQTGKLIGYILFNEYARGVYEIGWFFNRLYWHRGYAYEACEALASYAFQKLDAHKLFAETTDAVKSAGLMKKLGMIAEGVQREHILDHDGNLADLFLYGMLKSDWEHRKQ